MKWALPFIYIVADLGSVAGGWLSGYLIRRGWTVARARKTTMLICALCPPIAACGVRSFYVTRGSFFTSIAAIQKARI